MHRRGCTYRVSGLVASLFDANDCIQHGALQIAQLLANVAGQLIGLRRIALALLP